MRVVRRLDRPREQCILRRVDRANGRGLERRLAGLNVFFFLEDVVCFFEGFGGGRDEGIRGGGRRGSRRVGCGWFESGVELGGEIGEGDIDFAVVADLPEGAYDADG